MVRARAPRAPGYYLAYSRAGVDEYALYHDLGGAIQAARQADVLFLGNSRAMFALPHETLRSYFARRGLRFYVLAFGYNESNVFAEAIMRRHGLRPRLVVVNADPFFTDQPSSFARTVMSGTLFDAWKFRFETEAAFAVRRRLHRLVPYFQVVPPQRDSVLFRSLVDGTTYVAAKDGAPGAVGFADEPAQATPSEIACARRFQAELRARGASVILMCVPPGSVALAASLARSIDAPLIAPALRGLTTSDGNHLSRESAFRYSHAVLEQLDPVLSGLPERH